MAFCQMETTPKAAKVLSNCLVMHEWEQSQLANLATIHATTVSQHLSNKRGIRDDHLALYLPCLDRTEQRQLLAAWLQDVLPAAVQDTLLDPATGKLQEDVTTFALGLTSEQQSQLQFWAAKLASDDGLARIFDIISRKGGWKP